MIYNPHDPELATVQVWGPSLGSITPRHSASSLAGAETSTMAAGLPGGLSLQQGDWTFYMMASSKDRGSESCQPSSGLDLKLQTATSLHPLSQCKSQGQAHPGQGKQNPPLEDGTARTYRARGSDNGHLGTHLANHGPPHTQTRHLSTALPQLLTH